MVKAAFDDFACVKALFQWDRLERADQADRELHVVIKNFCIVY